MYVDLHPETPLRKPVSKLLVIDAFSVEAFGKTVSRTTDVDSVCKEPVIQESDGFQPMDTLGSDSRKNSLFIMIIDLNS